eukprot:COSAG01_NODE_56784_length_316_cov_0.811060_1_plen_53_part_01
MVDRFAEIETEEQLFAATSGGDLEALQVAMQSHFSLSFSHPLDPRAINKGTPR